MGREVAIFVIGFTLGFLATAIFTVKVRFPQVYNQAIKDYKRGYVKSIVLPADTTYVYPLK